MQNGLTVYHAQGCQGGERVGSAIADLYPQREAGGEGERVQGEATVDVRTKVGESGVERGRHALGSSATTFASAWSYHLACSMVLNVLQVTRYNKR